MIGHLPELADSHRHCCVFSSDLKQSDAIALRIYHVKARAGLNPHGGWVVEVHAPDCAWIKCVQPSAFGTEDLNLIENWIADINVARRRLPIRCGDPRSPSRCSGGNGERYRKSECGCCRHRARSVRRLRQPPG